MSDTVLGLVILLGVAAVSTLGCLVYSRRIDRMTPEEQGALKRKTWKSGDGGNSGCSGGGCGGGCGGG